MVERDWRLEDTCDASRSLLRAPERERIERHAQELLSRALNLGRTVAFVGAGTSMAYGRISWRDLVLAMQPKAQKALKAQNKGSPIDTLLEAQQIRPGRETAPEDFLTVFQLSEQAMQTAMPDDPRRFREEVCQLIADDRGHAIQILRDAVPALAKGAAATSGKLEEQAPKIGGCKNEDNFRKAAFLRSLLRSRPGYGDATLATHAKTLCERIDAFVSVKSKPDYLRPYHRFLIGVALRLVTDPKQRETLAESARWGEDPSRSELLPPERDPLMIALRYGIVRYLTTNYDSEIERLFEEDGYRKPGERRADDVRMDQLGRAWGDVVFDRTKVGHLLAFAARDGRTMAEVVHLHGRAQEKEITVTEYDYKDRYGAVDDRRSGMDDALNASFGANPILFIGSGIGEDDLLRPLRQFVRSAVPHYGQVAIALLPSLEGDQERERVAIRNLQRYGVYTMHYGRATLRPGAKTQGDDHLCNINAVVRRIQATLNVLLDDGNSKEDWRTLCRDRWNMTAGSGGDPFAVLGAKVDEVETMPVARWPGLDVEREIGVLLVAVGFCEALASDTGALTWGPTKALAEAYAAAVKGAVDSITGAFLCGRLKRLQGDWETWREDWLRIPKAQDPAMFVKEWARKHQETFRKGAEGGQATQDIVVFQRHGVNLDDTGKRFYSGAPSQTFNTLIDSLRERRLPRPTGRRIFLFVVRRGTGKGHFFAALAGKERLKEFTRSIGDPEEVRWPAAAFFNCSFSHEVASTFDQMTEFLLQMGPTLFGDAPARAVRDAAASLATSRIAKLRLVLREFGRLAAAGQNARQRVVIAFNGISILFERDGMPKSAQAAAVFEALVGPDAADAPVDFLFVSGEGTVPVAFRTRSDGLTAGGFGRLGTPALTLLARSSESEKYKGELRRRTQSLRISPDWALAGGHSYVHLLRSARGVVLATGFFPSVALAVALGALRETLGTGLVPKLPQRLMNPNDAPRIRKDTRAVLGRIAPEKREDRVNLIRQFFPDLLAGAAWLLWHGVAWDKVLLKADAYCKRRKLPSQADLENAIVKGCTDAGAPPDISRRLKTLGARIDAEFRELYRATGENRFAFTLLLATAYEFLLPLAEGWADPFWADPQASLGGCLDFLRRTRLTLDGLAGPTRVERIIGRAMTVHADNHGRSNWRLPREINKLSIAFGGLVDCKELFDVQRSILWHLAVIGQPVVTRVLARCPLLVETLCRLPQFKAPKSPPSVEVAEQVLDVLLRLLERRCLIMPVLAREALTGAKPRWTIHRLVQRHIFARLDAPFIEYSEVDQFSITLYGNQPNDMPRLSPELHRDLSDTVAAMIRFPEGELKDRPYRCWPDLNDVDDLNTKRTVLELRAQMLRAAFGIVRSVYSLSSIARFEPEHRRPGLPPAGTSPTDRGFIEAHRLLVRWMLHQADRHDRWCETLKGSGPAPSRPFYAEELVWLYNECAVLSFAQGRMPEAIALYDRAEEAARVNLEPEPSGPLRTRVVLNRAFADIERGRLPLAEQALTRIEAIGDEHPVVRLVAKGLLGLIDHLRGRQDSAIMRYREALDGKEGANDGLIGLKKSRAAALFSKYYGDLLRSRNDFPEARRRMEQGITLALEGGHEEARHQVQCSMEHLEMSESVHAGKPVNGRKLHANLDVVDAYARTMGLPRLQVEVALLRTELHRHGGDLKAAASVASRGMTIAAANDMRLRKATLLLRLAQAYEEQDLHEDCRPLLDTALEMARDTDYFSAFQGGQELYARITRGR